MDILLITPPLTQLNTPYPATTMLCGYLKKKNFQVAQSDFGIELIDSLFTKKSLSYIFEITGNKKKTNASKFVYEHRFEYCNMIEPVINFLRGKEHTLATRIANQTFLPEGHRFDNQVDIEWAFGISGTEDKARYFATLFIEDLSDYIRELVDPYFDLTKYAEKISNYAPTFDGINSSLQQKETYIDSLSIEILKEKIEKYKPLIVGFSVPFPGCLYSALRLGHYIKCNYPDISVAMGGGYPNTELRNISDKRFFKFVDYLILDDGELPLESLILYKKDKISESNLIRTFYLENDEIVFSGNNERNISFEENGIPSFEGLFMEKYFSLIETANPMHKLWTYGRWNKMVMAHGCYWAKCAFCDTSLDYICRYDAPTAKMVVDRMEAIIAETGETGFHFTDEAMPPKLLKEVCLEILKRNLVVSFWGNIRFEKSYDAEFCSLLSKAGCIAVSGGLEVASDRLLKFMNKGVSIEQTAKAAYNLTGAGIMVHTYLMYGFPTETLQESIDALEVIRTMFENGLIQSAFWHRFAMTEHSDVGRNPNNYGVKRENFICNAFSNNEVGFVDDFDYDVEAIGKGLSFATYNYMHGLGFEFSLQKWFSVKVPKPKKIKFTFL